jgi:Mn-dependent DtxR family transcriptional regulator
MGAQLAARHTPEELDRRVLKILDRGIALRTSDVASMLGMHPKTAAKELRKLRERHLVISQREVCGDGRGLEWRRHYV